MSETQPELFVISIRPARLREFEERLGPELCKRLTVVEGVDGSKLNVADLIRQNVYKPANRFNVLKRGEIGCFLSHRAVWERMVEEKIPEAIIFEDDCLVTPAILRSGMHMDECPPDWLLLYFARNEEFAPNKRKVSAHWHVPSRSWGQFFYALRLEGAKRLLDGSEPFTQAVDTFASSARVRGRYAHVPSLCGVKKVHSDTYGIL